MAVEINIPEDSVLISRTDTKGVITYASPDFLSISGYEDEELLKKPHNIIRHPDMPSQVFNQRIKPDNRVCISKKKAIQERHYTRRIIVCHNKKFGKEKFL